MYEFCRLADYTHTGALAEGNEYEPIPSEGNGELPGHTVGEAWFAVIRPPVASGVEEPLEFGRLIVDDKPYSYYINLWGTESALMAPPRHKERRGLILPFGTPLIYAMRGQGGAALLGQAAPPPIAATCPKFTKSISVSARAGSGGITADFRITIYGFRYDADDLSRLFPSPMPALPSIYDRVFDRTIPIRKPEIPITETMWKSLPGGLEQEKPMFFPYIRVARNANATDTKDEYPFRHGDVRNVDEKEEDLYWPFDIEKRALILQRIGIRAPAHLAHTWLHLDGKQQEHPRDKWVTTQFANPLHFGHGRPILREDLDTYIILPELQYEYVVYDQRGWLACEADGTAIAANQIIAAVAGVLIDGLEGRGGF